MSATHSVQPSSASQPSDLPPDIAALIEAAMARAAADAATPSFNPQSNRMRNAPLRLPAPAPRRKQRIGILGSDDLVRTALLVAIFVAALVSSLPSLEPHRPASGRWGRASRKPRSTRL